MKGLVRVGVQLIFQIRIITVIFHKFGHKVWHIRHNYQVVKYSYFSLFFQVSYFFAYILTPFPIFFTKFLYFSKCCRLSALMFNTNKIVCVEICVSVLKINSYSSDNAPVIVFPQRGVVGIPRGLDINMILNPWEFDRRLWHRGGQLDT